MQVEVACQRLCQSLGGEVHRLALQVQVLEESDTHAIEAEAVSSQYISHVNSICDVHTVHDVLPELHNAHLSGLNVLVPALRTQSCKRSCLQITDKSSQHALPWVSCVEGVSSSLRDPR